MFHSIVAPYQMSFNNSSTFLCTESPFLTCIVVLLLGGPEKSKRLVEADRMCLRLQQGRGYGVVGNLVRAVGVAGLSFVVTVVVLAFAFGTDHKKERESRLSTTKADRSPFEKKKQR
jgi:hypothetical protein